MSAFGGLARVVPLFGIMLTLAILSTVGLPGTNGFVGEFLVLIGTYADWPVLAVISTGAVILAAIYGLRALQNILFGPLDESRQRQHQGSLGTRTVRDDRVRGRNYLAWCRAARRAAAY